MPKLSKLLGLALILFAGLSRAALARVELTDDRLLVDGAPAPYLFGAEVQYFRARGGAGPNVPRAQVEALWDKLLDRVVEAHMNTVSFYVPWDFHEPVEGVFDFTGTLDRDGDGKPDYPSRDLKTFLRKVEAHGIKYVMIRPGPYINAEWGPQGFGAVPKWFLDNYPEALAVNRTPGRARVATFAHPVYRDHVRKWFKALYDQVLKDEVGAGKPFVFLQLDNETNYFWDSVYERDLSPLALSRWRAFLSRTYAGDVKRLNQAYGSAFASFAAVTPPTGPNDRTYPGFGWHYDWYNWHDEEIRDYFHFLRSTWESLGLSSPSVLFTRCDSWNNLNFGLLPRLDFGQEDGLALSTLNIYPKTYGDLALSTMNTPMKAPHDATILASAHRQVYGKGGSWVMATETVGGWFPPTQVSLATRQHTYVELLGNGVKAMDIYYFHEGYNWNAQEKHDSELAFDAPLDKDMNPRPAYGLLKQLGATLAAGLGDDLVQAKPVRAPVLIAHDFWTQYPSPGRGDAAAVASTDSAALFGLFRAAGALPDVAFIDRMSADELAKYRLVVWKHPGYIGQDTLAELSRYVDGGGTLVVIGDALGEVDVQPQGGGQVIRLVDDPAAGWNGDDYVRLPKAAASLKTAKDLLARAGVQPITSVEAGGKEPWVHAWVQQTPARSLLYVENFTAGALTVHVKVADAALPAGAKLTLTPRIVAVPDSRRAVVVDRAALVTGQGVALPLSPDGADLWTVEGTTSP